MSAFRRTRNRFGERTCGGFGDRKERGTTLSQLELQVEGKGSLPDSVAAHWRDCLGAWATANAKLVFYNADSSIVKPKVL
jgi:hypothetical protein